MNPIISLIVLGAPVVGDVAGGGGSNLRADSTQYTADTTALTSDQRNLIE